VDNGPEFAGRMLDQWTYLNGVEIDLSRPGKPTDNAFIEVLNARVGEREKPLALHRLVLPSRARLQFNLD